MQSPLQKVFITREILPYNTEEYSGGLSFRKPCRECVWYFNTEGRRVQIRLRYLSAEVCRRTAGKGKKENAVFSRLFQPINKLRPRKRTRREENMPDAEQMYFLCFLGFRCKTDENMVNFFRFYSIEGSRRQTVPALPRRRTRARGTGRKAESVSGQAKLLLNIAAEAAKIKRR